MTGQNGWCNEYLYIAWAALSGGTVQSELKTTLNMVQMHPLSIFEGGGGWFWCFESTPFRKSMKIIIKHQTQPYSTFNGPKWQFSYQNPILIAPWPYLKMKKFDFFLQNFLDGPKIFNLRGAGKYQAKPNHTLSSMAQNGNFPIKILS